jgi:hypothetical protein
MYGRNFESSLPSPDTHAFLPSYRNQCCGHTSNPSFRSQQIELRSRVPRVLDVDSDTKAIDKLSRFWTQRPHVFAQPKDQQICQLR